MTQVLLELGCNLSFKGWIRFGRDWKCGSPTEIIHQVSISPTFYEQLLCVQIPKAQKDNQLKQLFALLGYALENAGRNHIDEIDPRC